jgi:hypothetical protein
MRRKGVLRKKPLGFEIMDLRQVVIVRWMGKPLDAFSMIALLTGQRLEKLIWRFGAYRSMIVINGQVSAPAVAALATSTPSRLPRSFVFHGVERAIELCFTVDIVNGSAVAFRVGLWRL